MKANELRLCNLILAVEQDEPFNTVWKEKEVSSYSISDMENFPHHYAPIPLTEEWCSRTKFHVDITENIRIWTDGDKVFMEQYGEGVEEVKNMGYVHLRQNLYHALTGEELTIK